MTIYFLIAQQKKNINQSLDNMKTLNTYIAENFKRKSSYKYFPKTKAELRKIL